MRAALVHNIVSQARGEKTSGSYIARFSVFQVEVYIIRGNAVGQQEPGCKAQFGALQEQEEMVVLGGKCFMPPPISLAVENLCE